MNPLLDLGDDTGEDDFQKMLSDWESHIDTLQVNLQFLAKQIIDFKPLL